MNSAGKGRLLFLSLILIALSISSSNARAIPLAAAASEIAFINDKMDFADKCDAFVSADAFGKWGKYILDELHATKYPDLINGSTDLKAECPKYSSMEEQDKEMLWVIIVEAMTHYESSCNVNSTAQGPNGALAGLLQLHKGKESAYSKGCQNGDANTAQGTFRCGLSMLNDQINRGEDLFSRKSYWEVLRPQGRSQKSGLILKAIQAYDPCK